MTTDPSTHVPAPGDVVPTPRSNVFIRAWHGKEHLALVWWGFGIPLKVIAWALNTRWTVKVIYQNSLFIAVLVSLATIGAYVVITIMAWRCAPNTAEKGWKWVARALLVASWLWFFYRIAVPAQA